MENENKDNVFKNLATILSLLLPIAQVFTTLLPTEAKKIILFSDQLLVVSLFAGVMAYLLIVAFKSTVWFEFTFQKKRKQPTIGSNSKLMQMSTRRKTYSS